MNKIAFVVISALCVFTFFSCDLLTKPLLEQIGLGDVLQYAPDAESLSSADTTTLANAAGDISIAADPVASKAVLEALSTKVANDPNALNSILNQNTEENRILTNNILSLTTATVLPIDEIVQVAVNAMNDEDNSDDDDAQAQNVIQDMLDTIQFVDTRATEKILEAKSTQSAALSSEDASTVLLATISVAISACKSSPMVDLSTTAGQDALSTLMDTLNEDSTETRTPAQLANSILTNLSASGTTNANGVRALTSAITVLKNLAQRNDVTVSTESLMGMFTGGMGND